MSKLPVAIDFGEETLVASLSGEIDHHSARPIREDIDDAISRAVPQKLVLDFSHVTFMDSSGIGLLMGRYKQMSVYGGGVWVTGLNAQQKKVMRLAGLDRLIHFEETEANVDEKQNEAGI